MREMNLNEAESRVQEGPRISMCLFKCIVDQRIRRSYDTVYVCVCVCVRACVRACACVCVVAMCFVKPS